MFVSFIFYFILTLALRVIMIYFLVITYKFLEKNEIKTKIPI